MQARNIFKDWNFQWWHRKIFRNLDSIVMKFHCKQPHFSHFGFTRSADLHNPKFGVCIIFSTFVERFQKFSPKLLFLPAETGTAYLLARQSDVLFCRIIINTGFESKVRRHVHLNNWSISLSKNFNEACPYNNGLDNSINLFFHITDHKTSVQVIWLHCFAFRPCVWVRHTYRGTQLVK